MMNRLMKGSRALTFVLALALMFSLTACDDNGGGMDDDDDDNGDDPTLLSDILGDRDDLSILLEEASGEFDLAEDPDARITIFAPSDDAFADINLDAIENTEDPNLLTDVVQYHVLNEIVLSGDLSEGTQTTVQGDEIRITTDADGNFLVNGNSITTPDLEAENGVIHIIDGLLLENRSLAQRLGLTTPTTQLALEAGRLGADESLGTLENATLFAPRNIQDAIAESGLDLNDEQLADALLYHVIVDEENGPIDSDELISRLEDGDGEITVPTEQGEDLTIAQEGDEIVFNGGQATLDDSVLDKFTDNFANVFHVIDGVLLPPSLQPSNTIADVVANDDNFSTLLDALQDAGLVDALGDEEATFTVFAPNNDAFAPINTDVLLGQPDALEAVLGYHVVPDQELAADDLAEGENTVTTLAGDELTVVRNGDNVFVEGSQVVDADNQTDNGIIHVIDRPLLGNQNLANAAWFVSETEQLYNTVVDFGLGDAFVDADGWTVFGPNNTTFENADLSGFSEEEIQQVLQYHVYAESVVDSEGLEGLLEDNGGTATIPTLQGEDLTVAQDGDQIVFNDGQATLDVENLDYAASNGILHVIDGLLLPPSFTTTSLLDEDFSDESPDPFTVVDTPDSGSSWGIATFDNEQSPYMEANGFDANAPSNTWLISPALDFSANSAQTLSFANAKNFDDEGVDQGLLVKVSTDYDGEGNPEDFTWTDITNREGAAYSEGGYEFVATGEIDISDEAFQSESVYVAFQYISSGTGGDSTELWQVDDVVVTAQE